MRQGDLVIDTVWSSCSRFIAVGLSEMVEILDGVTLERLHTFPHSPIHRFGWLSFSPDGRLLTLFSDSDYKLITWDLQTGGRIGSIPSASNTSLFYFSSAYSMDGKTVAVAHVDVDDAVICISTYNLLSGTLIYSYRDSERLVVGPLWTHGEYLRFATVRPGSITIWEAGFTPKHTLAEIESFPALDGIGSGESLFLPTRSRLAFILDGAVMVWDTRDSKTLLNFVGGDRPVGLSFSSDGRFFACGTTGQEIHHLWKESPTGYVLHRKIVSSILDSSWFSPDENPTILLLSPNGESIIASKRPETQLWRTTDPVISLSSVPTQPVTETRFILDFSQDESLAAVARLEDNIATIIDLRSGDTRLIIDVGASIWGLRATGKTVVVVGEGGIITWNLPAEERVLDARVNINDSVRTIMFNHSTSPPGRAHSTSISPDLHYIAIGKARWDDLAVQNRLALYDMSTGNYLASTPIGRMDVDWLSFTPDEQEVWSADYVFGPQGWKIVKDRRSDVVRLEPLEKAESISDRFPSHGYEVTDDGWILNSRKTRLIWLPHSWRKECSWGEQFVGCMVDGLPEPVILELGE